MDHKEKLVKRKSKKTKLSNLSPVYLVALVSILSIGILSYSTIFLSQNKKSVVQKSTPKKNVVFVKQYSDTHITENAKRSESKFKNITFADKSSLLGNVVSSLKINNSVPQNTGPENGSWLWTPILDITPEYRDKIIAGARKNGIKNLYLSIDSYLDIYVMPEGEEKEKLKQKFDKIILDFISEAHKNNITVDAEAGWRNWAEMGNSYKAFATLNYAIDFNKNHDIKFRGFQYDVEPYLLDYFGEEKKSIMGNFVNLIDESVARLDNTDLTLSVVIPEFYDGTENITPTIYYAGQNLYPIEQLLRVLDKRSGSSIIVMSYRNFSRGENGSIDISKEEIDTANKYNARIIIGQETGEVDPPYITFFNTSKYRYDREIRYLTEAFKNDISFGGVATHYVNSFVNLH